MPAPSAKKKGLLDEIETFETRGRKSTLQKRAEKKVHWTKLEDQAKKAKARRQTARFYKLEDAKWKEEVGEETDCPDFPETPIKPKGRKKANSRSPKKPTDPLKPKGAKVVKESHKDTGDKTKGITKTLEKPKILDNTKSRLTKAGEKISSEVGGAVEGFKDGATVVVKAVIDAKEK